MDERAEGLADLSDVVRRTLVARTHDHHLVEDLTQETLVRVAAAHGRLDPHERVPYAVVTARNLLVSHGRGQSVQRRHAHRLVDYTGLDGPEQLVLEREETDALAVALDRLDADDRDLLLRHEVDGVDLATLAAEADTTPGAVAMRLDRARAVVRVEFVLAFRHVEPPTARCRSVLLSLSAGDRRRQERLDTTGHLATCSTCAALAPPVQERNRRIAGWLLLPAGDALRRIWRTIREHPVQTAAATAVAAAGAVVASLAVVANDSTTPADRPEAVAPDTTAAPASPTNPPVAVNAPGPKTESSALPDGRPCPPPVPLDNLESASRFGCPIAPSRVTVSDVPADEGFWATTTAGQSIWIHLVGQGESEVQITAGEQITIRGVIRRAPNDPARMGMPADDDPRLVDQQLYLEVPQDAIRDR